MIVPFPASPADGAKMQLHDFSKSVNILCVLVVSHGVGEAHKISQIGINKVPFLWLVTVWQFRQNREK